VLRGLIMKAPDEQVVVLHGLLEATYLLFLQCCSLLTKAPDKEVVVLHGLPELTYLLFLQCCTIWCCCFL